MILKGAQRGGAARLAAHLLNDQDNDHVEVHEIRGFISDDLSNALDESYLLSKGTRCKQHVFSLSLSPPANENIDTKTFEKAIDRIESNLALSGQPRVIVFHEKQGRRHAHAVWSRIDSQNMKAVNLPFYKDKLNKIAHSLYLEHEWQLPKGFVDKAHKKPLTYDRAQWEQAKRIDNHPHVIKSVLRNCWEQSGDQEMFSNQLKAKGYELARGDRRGFVAVDMHGQVYSLTKWLGVKKKQLTERLSEPARLQSVTEAKKALSGQLVASIKRNVDQINTRNECQQQPLIEQKQRMDQRHQQKRDALKAEQEARWEHETQQRQKRFTRGIMGLWHRLTGAHEKVQQQNDLEALQAHERDQKEKDNLIFSQLEEKKQLTGKFQRSEQKRHEEIERFKEAVFSHLDDEHRLHASDTFDHGLRYQPQYDHGFTMDM